MSTGLKVVLIAFIVLLLLVGVLFLVLWYRARQQRAGDKGLRPNRLKRVYSRFLRALPWRARSALRGYPWVVVLGDAGVGKSQLISSHIDWQGRVNQFFPSYTSDPLLQIYLGGRVVVHELAAPVVADNSPSAKLALRKLWEPLCKRMPPTVLVVLSFRALRHSTPEQIQRHAQLVRGKINLLSEILGEPVRTRICLTFMDRQPGFSEFVRLLSQHQISISTPLRNENGDLISFADGLTSYEKYLPLALTDLSSIEFRLLVEFLVNSPTILSSLGESLRILGEEIAFSQTPGFDRLYFSAEKLEGKLPNPFFVRSLQPNVALLKLSSRPLGFLRSLFDFSQTQARTHIIGCLIVAGLAAIIYGSIYFSHSRKVDAATHAVEHLEDSIGRAQRSMNPPSESQAVRSAANDAGIELLRLRKSEEGKPILWRLHQDEKQAAKNHFLEAVRRAYFLPALENYKQPKDRDRLIRTLGGLYAGRHNTLGHEIRRTPAEWATDIAMPEEILLKYVELSDPPWDGRAPIRGPLPTQDVAQSPAADLAPWLSYLTVLDAAFTSPTITRVQLQRLQQVTRRFSDALAQALKNRAAEHILRVLSEESAIDLKQLFGPAVAALMPPAWLADNADRLNGLFGLILNSSLEPARAEPLQLSELMGLLAAKTGQPGGAKQKDTVFAFELSSRSFRFSTLRWLELLSDSRRHDLLEGVGADRPSRSNHPSNKERENQLLPDDEALDGAEKGRSRSHHRRHHRHKKSGKSHAKDHDTTSAIVASSEKEIRTSEIPGSDSIPALYTRPGFEKEMKPNLLDAEKRLAASPLSPEQKQQVAKILMAQAKRYAKNYRDAQFSYHMGYKPKGDNLMSIVGMLTELLQPSSPLLSRLRAIADNAALGPLTGSYFTPMNEQLPGLLPLARVATNKDGLYPEYDKYKTIIAQLIKDVSNSGPETPATGFSAVPAPPDPKAPPKPGPPPPAFAPTGAARVAIAVLQGAENSPLRQIEAFLDAEGIVADLRKPFIAPLQRVYRLGMRDLENSVEKKWAQEYNRSVAPLLERYPFNRRAKSEVTPELLAPIRPPDGAFWTFVGRQIAPLCSENPDGSLAPLRGPLGSVRLPEELLNGLTKLRRLAKAMWAPDGAQKSIALSVKPLPLPPAQDSPQVVTETMLSCSNVSVNGFNQMPDYKPFPVPWFRQENSSVGVELGTADSKTRRAQTIDVNNSAWSFYRLLDKAQFSDGNVATWSLPGDGQAPPRQVRFAFESDPFAIFALGAFSPSKSSRAKDKELDSEP